MADIIDINSRRDILNDDYKLKHHLKYNFIRSQLEHFDMCKKIIEDAVQAHLNNSDEEYARLEDTIETFRLWDLIEIKLNKIRN